ncbi:hypothetical protein HO665_01210 [Streptococcus suis]|nr:hypothetical protein [Streptococcus suis]
MKNLLEYIGPIGLITLIIAYSIYRRLHPTTEDDKHHLPSRCPECSSTSIQAYKPARKRYSRTAAMMGHLLNGSRGAWFTTLYEADRTYYYCRYCGHKFDRKENRFLAE